LGGRKPGDNTGVGGKLLLRKEDYSLFRGIGGKKSKVREANKIEIKKLSLGSATGVSFPK
jgi:hypothetical protein